MSRHSLLKETQSKNISHKASIKQKINFNSYNRDDQHLKKVSEPEKEGIEVKVRRWAGIQVLKALMGFPPLPVE